VRESLSGKLMGVMKVTDWTLRWHNRPTVISCEWFECERIRRDPKDGELCLSRVKPEEIQVEARSDTDVQIVRRTWV
jgi:hypothetical protein